MTEDLRKQTSVAAKEMEAAAEVFWKALEDYWAKKNRFKELKAVLMQENMKPWRENEV